jgi:hypothetical protein
VTIRATRNRSGERELPASCSCASRKRRQAWGRGMTIPVNGSNGSMAGGIVGRSRSRLVRLVHGARQVDSQVQARRLRACSPSSLSSSSPSPGPSGPPGRRLPVRWMATSNRKAFRYTPQTLDAPNHSTESGRIRRVSLSAPGCQCGGCYEKGAAVRPARAQSSHHWGVRPRGEALVRARIDAG